MRLRGDIAGEALSPRQKEILDLIKAHPLWRQREIASTMGITLGTLKSHGEHIRLKTGKTLQEWAAAALDELGDLPIGGCA